MRVAQPPEEKLRACFRCLAFSSVSVGRRVLKKSGCRGQPAVSTVFLRDLRRESSNNAGAGWGWQSGADERSEDATDAGGETGEASGVSSASSGNAKRARHDQSGSQAATRRRGGAISAPSRIASPHPRQPIKTPRPKGGTPLSLACWPRPAGPSVARGEGEEGRRGPPRAIRGRDSALSGRRTPRQSVQRTKTAPARGHG